MTTSRLTPRAFRRWASDQTWLLVMLTIIAGMVLMIMFDENYQEAFREIIPGLRLTLWITILAFGTSMPLGLLLGLGRLSKRKWLQTGSQVYIEFMRGVPMIVWIFTVAFVLTPDFADLIGVQTRTIKEEWRGVAALSLFYAAFIAEVFRAGIQSVPHGTIEAGQALGLRRFQVMRRITLPQAIRNALPALGNDFIALMKDTALLSVLAVPELTQESRLYSGSSFRFREAFFILLVIYVALTLALSLILQWTERRLAIPSNLRES